LTGNKTSFGFFLFKNALEISMSVFATFALKNSLF